MSNPDPDCKSGYKSYKCQGDLRITNKYRDQQDSEINKQKAKEKAATQLPQRHKCYKDKLLLTKTSPPKGQRKKIAGPSSSSQAPQDQCCGDKNSGKGDNRGYMGRDKVNEYRETATDGPKINRGYRFEYEAVDVDKIRSMYNKERAYYDEMRNNTTTCCQYFNPPTYGCNPLCRERAIARANIRKRQLDNLWNQGYNSQCDSGWGPLMQFLQGYSQVPKKKYPIWVYMEEKTIEYEEVQEYKTNWTTGWKCLKDDSRPCCCSNSSSSCDCEVYCTGSSVCPENQSCEPVGENCPLLPGEIGCCRPNCEDPCTNNGDCSVVGETCKNGCCWDGDCRYGQWYPYPDQVCLGTNFQQTRELLEGPVQSCTKKTQTAAGTKNCSTTSSLGFTNIDQLLESLKDQVIKTIQD
jgi:hypothetical protein